MHRGYKIAHSRIIQKSNSAILLEKNGKLSSSKRAKQINTRYLFVMYRVSQSDL